MEITYYILKGWHYSLHLPRVTTSNVLSLKVRFTESCRYNHGDVDQLDINKLVGLAFGHIHWNSYRIGWRYDVNLDVIELFHYYYLQGERKSIAIKNVEIGEEFSVYIACTGKYIHTSVGGLKSALQVDYPLEGKKRLCFPYFGGNKPAKQLTKIQIKWHIR
jgi:hypothetical protein